MIRAWRANGRKTTSETLLSLLQIRTPPDSTQLHTMTNSVDVPARSGSPRSVSPASSASGSPPPQLDPTTLALLDSFYNERTAAEQKFQELEEAAHARLLKAQGGEGAEQDDEAKEMMSVDEFRSLFGEDWQLSQFW